MSDQVIRAIECQERRGGARDLPFSFSDEKIDVMKKSTVLGYPVYSIMIMM